jgi:hypothetical protein
MANGLMMHRGSLVAVFGLLAACTPDVASRSRSLGSPRLEQIVLPWGTGPAEVGLDPGGREHLAQGVSAVAVDRAGRVHLLDRLNGRVLRIAAGGLQVATRTEPDGEHLALGPDDAIAVFSPWRSRVRISADGRAAGELAVPRELRHVLGISLGASRRVGARTALQETFVVGSPSLPQTLPAVLMSKREGAFTLRDGSGVAVRRLSDGRPEVMLLRTAERTHVVARHALPERVLAAQLIGAVNDLVCARLEIEAGRAPAGELRVQRRLVCLDAVSGTRVLERELAPPGLYLPVEELAVGGDPRDDTARVAFISPQPEGLRLTVWPLVGGAR